MILLVGLAASDVGGGVVIVLLATVGGAVAAFYSLFPRSHFVAIAFANLIAVYACIFIFFIDADFTHVDKAVMSAGFVLPIMAVLLGAAWHQREIGNLIASERLRGGRNLIHVLGWLAPVFAIGVLSFVASSRDFRPVGYDAVFLAAMGGISAIVAVVSRNVSTFLLDAGLLFEEFFERVTRLLVPAFAFLTFYSLLVIVFGAAYRIADHFSADYLFRVEGAAQKISVPEALYSSIVTLSTVGYGDIVPLASVARLIVALQIVCGILLLLFGFSEIIAYTRDRSDRRRPR